MKYIFLMLFLIFFNNTKGTTIQGVLIDNKTQDPVSFANIFLNKYSSTTCDINGNFIIYIKNFIPNDTLLISCIGYNRKAILLKDLDTTGINKILLMPVVYILNPIEITAKGITAYDLLQTALKEINTNCKDYKHYLKGTYFEQINNYNKIMKWHKRSVKSAVIIEDPGYDKIHHNWFNNILEKVYILGILKNNDSLNYLLKDKAKVNEPNFLKWTLEENYCRYKCEYFSSAKSYNYTIKNAYYDSTLKTNIIEISIIPKDPKENVVYGEVSISSSDHKIFRIHFLYKNEDYPISINKNSKYYYKMLNSDIIVDYKPDNENKMMLTYIKYEFGEGSFYYDQNKPYVVSKKSMELKIIGEVENGENVVKKFPKMENSTNIYDQKMMNNKAFWLDYNILIKE